MVEVFKTNVKDRSAAYMLLDAIHNHFIYYKANFDLDDRDRILRVVSSDGPVQNDRLIDIIMGLGFQAEVLPDELSIVQHILVSIENPADEYN